MTEIRHWRESGVDDIRRVEGELSAERVAAEGRVMLCSGSPGVRAAL